VLYQAGDAVALSFDLVCLGNACGEVSGALTLTTAGAGPEVLKTVGSDHFEFGFRR